MRAATAVVRGIVLLALSVGLVTPTSICQWSHYLATAPSASFAEAYDAGEGRLSCRSRTLQQADDDVRSAGLSNSRLERTTSLTVECSDVLFFESGFQSSSLHQLVPRLRHLDIEACKIRDLPAGAFAGFPELRQLSIRTQNTNWPAMALSMSPASFVGLKELRTLDLSDNSLLTTPDRLFCPLPSLTHLNLSTNRLQTLEVLGLSAAQECLPELTVLDLAWNDLSSLTPHVLSGLRRLQSLHLQHNGLQSVADQALYNLESLRVLNMSSNSLSVLPPEVFRDTPEIRELDLRNNSLSVLPPGLFDGLLQLQVLDLSHNALASSTVHRDSFPGLVRLVVLNLAHNSVSRLDGSVFKDLASLQVLRLEHNLIDTIDPETFVPLFNLHTLVLAHNRLSVISDRLLGGLFVLSSLSVSDNAIAHLHPDAFKNCSGLRDVDVARNHLTRVPPALSHLALLRSLDLAGNRILHLGNDSFIGLEQLYHLDVSQNSVSSIHREALAPLKNLVSLNVAHNGLEGLEANVFDACQRLQVLRVDGNRLVDMNGLFSGLNSLRWLNVSSNRIALFDYSFLPLPLEWLDLHGNQVTDLGNYFQIEAQLGLRALDASFNRITRLQPENVPHAVEELLLNNNLLEDIAANTFLKAARISRVDLNANRLSHLEPAALWLSPVESERDLPEFSLGDNPWVCDCGLEWLPPLIQPAGRSRQQPRLADPADMFCTLPFSRAFAPSSFEAPSNGTAVIQKALVQNLVPMVDVTPEQFLCEYETHCFALCHCCDFDACDCEMTCPPGCHCYHDPTWSANLVNCAAQGVTEFPGGIPMDATELYLDGNVLGELGSHVLIGRKNLRVLYLNASAITSLRNRTFHGLGALTSLHLEENLLTEIRGSELEPLEQLRELYLQNNRLTYVAERAFAGLKELRVLRLDGNALVNSFAVWRLAGNSHLTQVHLARNPWSCNCRFLVELQLWAGQSEALADADVLSCVAGSNPTAPEVLLYWNYSDFNATCDTALHLQRRPVALPTEYVPVMVATMLLCLVLVIVLVCGFVYRETLKLWLFTRYGIRLCQKARRYPASEDNDKLFDAYISYSLKDEQFVTQVLAAELEHGSPSYHVCLQHRDLANLLPSNEDPLHFGLAVSKRIVLVVSQSFLEAEWPRPEVRNALTSALRSQRHPLLVLVFLTHPTETELDPDLRLLTQTAPFTQWGDRSFWAKLRYALPDPSSKHYLQNINAGHHLWYEPAGCAPAEAKSETKPHLPAALVEASAPARPAFPSTRRYTHTPTNYGLGIPSSHTCGTATASSSTPAAVAGPAEENYNASACSRANYSRLEHSYMTIDSPEPIYSSLEPVDDIYNRSNSHHSQSSTTPLQNSCQQQQRIQPLPAVYRSAEGGGLLRGREPHQQPYPVAAPGGVGGYSYGYGYPNPLPNIAVNSSHVFMSRDKRHHQQQQPTFLV